jgi:cytochrome c
VSDAGTIVKYVLSLAYPERQARSLPVSGTYSPVVPEGENKDGSFILRAAYTDRGTKTAAAQTGQSIIVLHAPVVPASKANETKDISFNIDSTVASVKAAGAWLRFNKIDLTGIKELEFATTGGGRRSTVANGTIEVYANSMQGKLLGKFSGDYATRGMKISLPDGTAGISDLYFVFNGSPLRFSGIKFNNGN